MTALRALKHRVKLVRGKLRTAYVRRFRAFGPPEFKAMLVRLGVAPGDIVMAHSSFDRFEGFRGTALDAIRAMEEAIGSEGTLLMPTLPFTGTARAYVESGEITDVRRTPSRMGLLTEFFRRMGGVVRSVHPTHPIAARGKHALEMIEGHSTAKTPCGVPSPFSKLLDRKGKILLLGTSVHTITFFHYAEEVLEPVMPFSPFTKETFTLTSRSATGESVTTVTRLYDPHWAKRRNLSPLEEEMRRRKTWRVARVGLLEATLLDATEVLGAMRDLAAKGVYCYRTEEDGP